MKTLTLIFLFSCNVSKITENGERKSVRLGTGKMAKGKWEEVDIFKYTMQTFLHFIIILACYFTVNVLKGQYYITLILFSIIHG